MSLKTAGIREFARMIGRSHSWVVSQCQRNIIPKTTDGKIPVDEALKAVARLFAAVRARTRARETFRKPPSRLEAQGVEADCEARGKIKNDKARGRFAGH